MRYLSVCSGIEAASVAWHPLGWTAAAYSEIEAAPRAVLAHHYPDTPLHGDFTTIRGDEYGAVDLLVGGTPCQSFSIAGLRGGLADDRGNLALEYLRLADRCGARWLVWENVPGVLSIDGGRAFGAILGGMAELGYGFAYRILDAQFFGVPQRRRRVFVVGYLGDWRRAAAVLFERHSLSGHPAPSREKGPGVAALTANGVGTCGADNNQGQAGHLIASLELGNQGSGGNIGWHGPDRAVRTLDTNCPPGVVIGPDLARCVTAREGQRQDFETETLIAHTLRAEGFDASEDGTGRGTPLVPVAFDTTQITSAANYSNPKPGDPCHPLLAGAHAPAICFSVKDHGADAMEDCSPTLRAGGFTNSHANAGVMPAVAFAQSVEPMYGVTHADASQAHPDQALRALRDAVGTEAYSEWCAGILAAFRTPEVLQSKVHGRSVRWARDDWHKLGDDALSCPQDGAAWPMLALWQAGCVGRSPRGWQPPERLARELVAHLSELPRQRASAARFLLGLWRASEGLGLLREALSALQEAWRPDHCEGQSAPLTSAVRRLTPTECLRLQGFPDDYFDGVMLRGKPLADGPRYKALGNSMAVPVMRWIGERMALVETHIASTRRAA